MFRKHSTTFLIDSAKQYTTLLSIYAEFTVIHLQTKKNKKKNVPGKHGYSSSTKGICSRQYNKNRLKALLGFQMIVISYIWNILRFDVSEDSNTYRFLCIKFVVCQLNLSEIGSTANTRQEQLTRRFGAVKHWKLTKWFLCWQKNNHK